MKLVSAIRIALFISCLLRGLCLSPYTETFHSAQSCTERDVRCTVLSQIVRHQRGQLIRLCPEHR